MSDFFEDGIKPDLDDEVSYGVAVWSLDGTRVTSPAPTGIVTQVFKNGSIRIKSLRSGSSMILNPLEFTVLRKAW